MDLTEIKKLNDELLEIEKRLQQINEETPHIDIRQCLDNLSWAICSLLIMEDE